MPRKKIQDDGELENLLEQSEYAAEEEQPVKEEKKLPLKKSYTVVLVAKTYVICVDKNGSGIKTDNIWKDIKIGDEVAIE